MAVFKCKICGGELNVKEGMTVCECEYCTTKQTLPKLDDEKRLNLYERANHFRRNNEFDKAMGIYEMILSEDNTDAEAYWSIVLCRYGIEYVDDPTTYKKIPTVNRAQMSSIFNDSDYQKAIVNADRYQRDVYEAEAKSIDDIQKGILEISNKEDPYDVFICYKETDAQGKRTHDSVYAQDIYNSLTKEGYRVFFSRITLEDKIGRAYEPYIFAALNSAKVMLVVSTSAENMNAVWVKNEWSRYLAIVKQDSSKVLIPCYKDMSPYDMPEEFAFLQSQDMSKIGFIQDLIHGVQKVVSKKSFEQNENSNYSANKLSTIAPLLERAHIFLKEKNWEKAIQYTERVLDAEPKNAEAYLCKVLVHFKITSFENLMRTAKDDHIIYNLDFNDYLNAVEFSSGKLSEELKEFEKLRMEALYYHGCKEMEQRNFEKAVAYFESIKDYKDSAKKLEECNRCVKTVIEQHAKIRNINQNLQKLETDLKNAETQKQQYNNELNTNIFKLKEEKRKLILPRFIIIGLLIGITGIILFIVVAASVESGTSNDLIENGQVSSIANALPDTVLGIIMMASGCAIIVSMILFIIMEKAFSIGKVLLMLMFYPLAIPYTIIKTIIKIVGIRKDIKCYKNNIKNLKSNAPDDASNLMFQNQIQESINMNNKEKQNALNVIKEINGNDATMDCTLTLDNIGTNK